MLQVADVDPSAVVTNGIMSKVVTSERLPMTGESLLVTSCWMEMDSRNQGKFHVCATSKSIFVMVMEWRLRSSRASSMPMEEKGAETHICLGWCQKYEIGNGVIVMMSFEVHVLKQVSRIYYQKFLTQTPSDASKDRQHCAAPFVPPHSRHRVHLTKRQDSKPRGLRDSMASLCVRAQANDPCIEN